MLKILGGIVGNAGVLDAGGDEVTLMTVLDSVGEIHCGDVALVRYNRVEPTPSVVMGKLVMVYGAFCGKVTVKVLPGERPAYATAGFVLIRSTDTGPLSVAFVGRLMVT